jgi:hypothetical protein
MNLKNVGSLNEGDLLWTFRSIIVEHKQFFDLCSTLNELNNKYVASKQVGI